MVKFLRRTWNRYLKLGKKRKKKQVWRKPKGRDNKMREKRKGYPATVSIGYKKDKKIRGDVEDKNPVIIQNTKELKAIGENEIVIIGNVGKKKKIEIVKKAKEMKINIYNLNTEKFLKQIEIKKSKISKSSDSKKLAEQKEINSKKTENNEKEKNEIR
jgi:large subunit ribosomal protein L32e